MKLYNSLSRKIEDIKPLKAPVVTIYSCGPTVYDNVHIGNLSSFIYADTLRRALVASGYEVKHVMNFTDVDDKTIKASQEKYPDEDPKLALGKLTSEYGEKFLADFAAVGNDASAYKFVKATDSIDKMQSLIRQLHEQKSAYIADDGVYFSIEAYKASGKTYGQLAEITSASTSESRISNDEYDKDNAHDFALWKKQKPGEPAWDFDLAGQDLKGRPGWHIECSAMSASELGQPFDIHTGGVDLKFPHHENEIAQSTAGQNKPFANYFVHNEHILVDNQKMSKSLGNFITLNEIVEKGYDPLAFRLLVLQSHYRNQAHFSWKNLDAAANRLKNWRAVADRRWQASEMASANFHEASEMLAPLADDLNTPQVLANIDQTFSAASDQLLAASDLEKFDNYLENIDSLLGIDLTRTNDISSEQKTIIASREKARVGKDFAKSDQLRDQLAGQGIGLNDTASGAVWYRT